MMKMDRFLDIYFRKILEVVAMIPPPQSYSALRFSGAMFRKFEQYDPGMGEAGILLNAIRNITDANIASSHKAKQIIKEYLKFESRFVLENIWIRKQYEQYILKSFHNRDIVLLDNMLKKQNYVIVSAHTSGLYAIVELLRIIEHESPFILMNMLKQPWDKAAPIQRSVIQTIPSWINHQALFFVENGNVVNKSREVLRSGKSVLIAPDVPGYAEKGVSVMFMGKRLISGVGAAILANSCKLPMLMAIPYASRCDESYRIFMKTILPTGDIRCDMTEIYRNMEYLVREYPACWGGWLYLDKMIA